MQRALERSRAERCTTDDPAPGELSGPRPSRDPRSGLGLRGQTETSRRRFLPTKRRAAAKETRYPADILGAVSLRLALEAIEKPKAVVAAANDKSAPPPRAARLAVDRRRRLCEASMCGGGGGGAEPPHPAQARPCRPPAAPLPSRTSHPRRRGFPVLLVAAEALVRSGDAPAEASCSVRPDHDRDVAAPLDRRPRCR